MTIQTKAATKQYRDGWDRTFGKRKPSCCDWLKMRVESFYVTKAGRLVVRKASKNETGR